MTTLALLPRAALLGLLFAMVAAAMDGSIIGVMMTRQHMPPMTGMMVTGTLGQLVLGLLLGALATPFLRKGVLAHGAAVALSWAGLGFLVALDRSVVLFWLVGPASATLVYALGVWLSRRLGGPEGRRPWRFVPAGLTVVWLIGALAAPSLVFESATSLTKPLNPRSPPAGAPDVVFVVLDTVRTQNMSAYGYDRPTTPHFDALAQEGVLFMNATAPSTWSLPSHASLFTGTFPSTHGAHDEARVLRADRPTLAETLGAWGYETRCFTANPHISDGFGLTRGFQSSDEAWRNAGLLRDFLLAFRILNTLGYASEDKGGGAVVDNFEAWVQTRPADAPPAFVFLNFLEAHFPFQQVPEPFLSQFSPRSHAERLSAANLAMAAMFGGHPDPAAVAQAAPLLREMYDAGVAYSDHLLHRVVKALEAKGTLDKTLLVVVSDHGELLGEHDRFGHGPSLYEEDLHVPLMLRYPPQLPAGQRIEPPVSTVGVFATLLELVQIEAPPVQVGSLLPLLDGRPAGQPVLTERYVTELGEPDEDPMSNPDWRYRVYRSGSYKLAESTGHAPQLYDLASDPGELNDLAAQSPELLTRLQGELRDWERALGLPALDAAVDAAAPKLDAAAEERLRALGYVE